MDNAKYTVLLKTLLENPITSEKINKALSSYPIYEPESPELKGILIPTREQLNTKILNYYKYREIGFETVGRFIDELEISMCEIMPYYNQLFHTVDISNSLEDIFGNVDVKETFTETREGISKGKGNTETTTTDKAKNSTKATDKQTTKNSMIDNSKTVKTDTPQSELSITAENIDTVSYANDVTWNKNSSNNDGETSGENSANTETESNGSSTSSGTNESTTSETTTHEYTKKGNQGVNTYAHDIIEFRQTILNIEQQIINDKRIKELFMLVF